MVAKVAQVQFQAVLDALNEQVSRLGELPTTAEPSSPTRGRETLNAALNLKRRYLCVSGRIIRDFLAGPPKVVSVMDLKQARGKKVFDFAGSTGLINGVPTTAGSFTFHGPGQGRDPCDRHRDLHDRDPPARGGFAISRAAASMLGSELDVTQTRQSSASSDSATARPSPRLAAVTRARLSRRPSSMTRC